MDHDAIVLGAGPAGLGAALALVRSGARVAVVDAGERVGGLSITMRRDEHAFDLGGHILFVHDGGREAWLRELLGPDLRWIDRPVASVDGERIVPGRYLDRRTDGIDAPPLVPVGDASAATMLNGLFGEVVVERHMRRYLEKVDGMPLEVITATRARKLLVEQYAPDGFWFPARGVGQLMDAMARGIRAGGGDLLTATRVTSIDAPAGLIESVTAVGADGRAFTLRAPTVIGAIPPGAAARLVQPPMPADVAVELPPRAAIIVALAADTPKLTDHAWIQVDRPDVPFARLAEMKNWSPALSPRDSTVLVCEVYCHPTGADPWWPATDEEIGAACAAALVDAMGLLDGPVGVRTLEVVRLPRAWSLVAVESAGAAQAPVEWLGEIGGFVSAQGGDVVAAIAAGEHAAAVARAVQL